MQVTYLGLGALENKSPIILYNKRFEWSMTKVYLVQTMTCADDNLLYLKLHDRNGIYSEKAFKCKLQISQKAFKCKLQIS